MSHKRLTQWVETDNGKWPVGVIDPRVLRAWYEEDQLDALRQTVFSSVIDLIGNILMRDEECQRLTAEADRLRVALGEYAERNHWGYSDVLSPERVEDMFITSRATGMPGWRVAEEALKYE